MRLSDKNIQVLMDAANRSDPEAIGYGDVLMMGCEIQERRAADPVMTYSLPDDITNATVMEGLIKRVEAGEGMLDRHVLGLFHAWKRQGFFSTVTLVNSEALRDTLHAVEYMNQCPHILREMVATRDMPLAQGEKLNPIDQLVKDANEGALDAAGNSN